MITKSDLPVAGGTSTKFAVPAQSLGDGSSAYGTVGAAASGSWVIGSALKGWKVLVVVNTGAASNSPTGLKLGLYENANDTGNSPSLVTGTDTEWTTSLDNNVRVVEMPISSVDEAKYYSLGLSINGAGSATLLASATGLMLQAPHI